MILKHTTIYAKIILTQIEMVVEDHFQKNQQQYTEVNVCYSKLGLNNYSLIMVVVALITKVMLNRD